MCSDTAPLALLSLKRRVQFRAVRLPLVQPRRLQCFLPDDPAWLCPELERSTASSPATMQARFARASLSSPSQICRVEPPSLDSHPCSPDGSAEACCGSQCCQTLHPKGSFQ